MKILLRLALILSLTASYAGTETEEELARLQKQTETLQDVAKYLLPLDRSRVEFLIKENIKLSNTIIEYGLTNGKTFQEFQIYIVKYRYSGDFFKNLSKGILKQHLESVINAFVAIEEEKGIDSDPFFKISYSVFDQLKVLLMELKKREISKSLKDKISNLLVTTGRFLGKSSRGDRRTILNEGVVLYKKYTEIYPDFEDLYAKEKLFDHIIQIQGLLEFYGEYVEADKE